MILFTNPSARAGYDTRSIFKRSLTGLNSEFSFSKTSSLTKTEEPSLSYYLPIAGGRIIGFIPFPRVLVLCEMQSVSSRIGTRVAVSISYDDKHYTTYLLYIVKLFQVFLSNTNNSIWYLSDVCTHLNRFKCLYTLKWLSSLDWWFYLILIICLHTFRKVIHIWLVSK